MHRFGRSAQHKTKDRWGGSFILATILALVLAVYGGKFLGEQWGAGPQGADPNLQLGAGDGFDGTSGSAVVDFTVEPQPFTLYLVQAGAFRSEASAKNLVRTLAEQQYSGAMGPRSAAGLYPVYAGVFTDASAAETMKANLEAAGIKGPFTQKVTVDHNPAALPVAAMGSTAADMKKGLDSLNTYLHEVALWMENRATGAGSTDGIATRGRELAELAVAVSGEQEPKAKEFAELVTNASLNASAVQAAASPGASTEEFHAAMQGYLTLLEQYRSFQLGR